MTVQSMAINQIKPSSRNARTHSAKQIRQIANSMVAFGFTNPLLVSEDGELIAGHGRYEAAKLLGLAEVPVIVVGGLSLAKRRALSIADNKIAQNSRWDRERLAIEIPELADLLIAEGLDVSILGFAPVEINDIQIDFSEDAADPQDRIDPTWCEALPVSKPGDLWEFDSHRLLCGDPCSPRDITRLMSNCRADLAFLDPLASGKVPSPDFVSITLNAAASVSREGAIHFVGLDRQYIAEIMAAAKPIYGEPIDVIAWVKSKAVPDSFYRSQHELIGVFCIGQTPHLNSPPKSRSRSNVWHYTNVKPLRVGNELCSIKPVALVADAIKDCTQTGNIILDIFSNAGTTIMAAERVERHARALEVEPRFVDVAIRRWQAFTRRDAIHAESGLSFDEIAADSARPRQARATI